MLKIPKCDIITKTEKELLKLAMNSVLEFLEAKKKIPSFTSLISTDLQRNYNLDLVLFCCYCFFVCFGFFCF